MFLASRFVTEPPLVVRLGNVQIIKTKVPGAAAT